MFWQRLKAAAEGWSDDEAGEMGASLAYYTLFSFTPVLLLAIVVVGFLYGGDEARKRVVAQVAVLIDQGTADTVGSLIESASQNQAHPATSIVGLASLLFGATGMFTSLRTSLQRIWRVKPRPGSAFGRLVRTYLVSLTMVLVSCGFLILLLAASAATAVLSAHEPPLAPYLSWAGPALDFVASVTMLTVLFLFTFRFLSDGQIPYRQLAAGAVTSAVLFAVGKIGIGFYLAYVHLASAYGAAGSLVVFLVWVYYSAQIVFFGAEVVRAGLPTPTPEQEAAAGPSSV